MTRLTYHKLRLVYLVGLGNEGKGGAEGSQVEVR
jgi:hypothetical protein